MSYSQTPIYIAVSSTSGDHLKGGGPTGYTDRHIISHVFMGRGCRWSRKRCMRLLVRSRWHGQGIDTIVAVQLSVLLGWEIEMNTGICCRPRCPSCEREGGYVNRKHACALVGSDNLRCFCSNSLVSANIGRSAMTYIYV